MACRLDKSNRIIYVDRHLETATIRDLVIAVLMGFDKPAYVTLDEGIAKQVLFIYKDRSDLDRPIINTIVIHTDDDDDVNDEFTRYMRIHQDPHYTRFRIKFA